ncbi:MAG: hypothetical protein EPO55_07690 [Reyranella sp.]|uniref:hypothetical protein n=1 Tax=Reyranella sp. TaxID=1929291 RepID=UPI0012051CBF|nr:hypothetical protein [Reyranella sp.]TAJ40834.1 MAG: hypothetical protein EPO55_07690 [Reyranella sp.]
MSILVWMFLALLGSLLAWEGAARLRRWRAGRAGERPADDDRVYSPEVELRRGLDAAASSADHASAVGLRARVGPRR